MGQQDSSRLGVTQTISYDASVAITNAFGAQTYQVRLVATTACCVAIGDGVQTATVANPYLPANVPEYVTVSPGQRVAAIKFTGGTAGVLYVTEIA